ncbi:MAG: site-2 protease family protein [Olsenella sp.]|jgi:Zn-dependent protease
MYQLMTIITAAISVALLMFSAMVHEVAHGWVAYKLGDPTAKNSGRLTLNPKAHLDPFGSIVLPLIMVLLKGPVFAYAKPVPYNPRNLRHPDRDEVLVAIAGPASNILQALIGALLFDILYPVLPLSLYGPAYWLLYILSSYVYVNLMLAFFNLIPLPPLDGSKIIMPLLHGEARQKYYAIQQYAMPILIIVLYLVPMVFHADPLGIYLNVTADRLYSLLLGA